MSNSTYIFRAYHQGEDISDLNGLSNLNVLTTDFIIIIVNQFKAISITENTKLTPLHIFMMVMLKFHLNKQSTTGSCMVFLRLQK